MGMGFSMIALGLLFTGFGYAIYVKKKYHLINGYVDGKMSQNYAKNLGAIELFGGLACGITGIISFLADSQAISIILFLFCVVSISVAFIWNAIKGNS